MQVSTLAKNPTVSESYCFRWQAHAGVSSSTGHPVLQTQNCKMETTSGLMIASTTSLLRLTKCADAVQFAISCRFLPCIKVDTIFL